MDWEFDEDMLLTYNNPVFVEQCKRRNKDFDKLNEGWVKQKKIGEEEEEMAEDEDLDDEDELDEDDEEELFMNPTISKKPDSKPIEKFEDKPSEKPKEPIEIKKPSIETKDLNAALADMFDDEDFDDDNDDVSKIDIPNVDMPSTSEKPVIAEKPVKPAIKINVKKPIENKSDSKSTDGKPKIKLNINKPKN